jgi:hypothetical protein
MNPMDLAHAFARIVNFFIFEWMVSRRPYPLISTLYMVLEIFLGRVQQIERRRWNDESETFR